MLHLLFEKAKDDLRQRKMDKEFQAMQAQDRASGLMTAPIKAVNPKTESKALSPEVKQLIDDGNKKYDKSLEAKSLKGSSEVREAAAKELDMRRRLDVLQGREPSSSLSSKGGNTKGMRRK